MELDEVKITPLLQETGGGKSEDGHTKVSVSRAQREESRAGREKVIMGRLLYRGSIKFESWERKVTDQGKPKSRVNIRI